MHTWEQSGAMLSTDAFQQEGYCWMAGAFLCTCAGLFRVLCLPPTVVEILNWCRYETKCKEFKKYWVDVVCTDKTLEWSVRSICLSTLYLCKTQEIVIRGRFRLLLLYKSRTHEASQRLDLSHTCIFKLNKGYILLI